MGKKHHGHSFGKEHGHHKHGWFGGHHHGKHDFLFGTRADDVLNGTDKNDVIVGRKGDDQLFGRDGNDWLDGGKGNDKLFGGDGKDKLFGGNGRDELFGGDGDDKLFGGRGDDVLDGGAGSDKGYGGKGNDTIVYKLAENAGTDACGNETRDYFDGGKGKDTLHLILTKDEYDDPEIQAELERFQDFLDQNPGGCGRNGEVFEFSFGLTVRNLEKLEVETGNTPPVANPDDYTVSEDPNTPLTGNVLDNDTDADGDTLTAALELLSGPAHGTLNLSADGSFSYMPEANFYGEDQFSYRANDGTDDSDPVTVDITVLPVNDKPTVMSDDVQLSRVDDYVQLSPGKFGYVIDVLANDSPGPGPEADDQTLVIRPASGPFFPPQFPTTAGGTWELSPDMTLVWYIPPTPDYVGTDTFRYAAQDDGFPPMSTALSPFDPVDITIV